MTGQLVIEDQPMAGSSHAIKSRVPINREDGKAPRQRQILSAAFEEFAANGYAAARLDRVARRARIAKGTVYLYFPSKSRLFQAVVRSLIRPVPDDFQSIVAASPVPASQLLAEFIARQYSGLVGNRKAREIVRLLIAESGKFPELSELYRREVIDPGMRAIGLLLEKGIASGEFRASPVRDFPQMIAAPAVLAAIWTLIFGSQFSLNLDAYRDAHVQFALAGLGCVSKSSPQPDAATAPGDQS